jgi:mono/diheme cytochrome c family protein
VRVAFGLLSFLLLAGCAGTALPRPTDAHAAAAQGRWPGLSTADLARGRELYAARCSSCHVPVQPTAVPASEWPGHVEEMAERAHLDQNERQLVIAYVVTMAQKP